MFNMPADPKINSFLSSDVSSLLMNRFVVIIGDSIQRAIYKDLVLLLQNNRCLKQSEMKSKGEESILGDTLIEGGCKGVMSNGIGYKEVRQYKTDVHLVRFYFVTRCYNQYVESILSDLKQGPQPDLVIMNSCLWDMTRYGMGSIAEYKENLQMLFNRLSSTLPSDCLVVWNTTLPISASARGGFLVPEIEFMTTTLRLDILEANFFARQVVADHGFDVLDLHFYLRHHIQRRARDGVHWDMIAHRDITCLILTHVCKAWGVPLPKREADSCGNKNFVANQTRSFQCHSQNAPFRNVVSEQQANSYLHYTPARNGNVMNQSTSDLMGMSRQCRAVRQDPYFQFGIREQENFQFGNGFNNFTWQRYQQNPTTYTRAPPHNFYGRHQPYAYRRY